MFGNIGTPELILIFLVILVFFGAKKIPDIARGLGQGVREFRKAVHEAEDAINRETQDPAQLPPQQKVNQEQHQQPS
jgi:sec-independent protein translocase protein TatA